MYCSVNAFAPIETDSAERCARTASDATASATSPPSSATAMPHQDAAPLADARFEQPDQLIEPERQRSRGDAADQDRVVVARREAAEDVVAEAGRADRRRERRGAHHPDRRGANARDDRGQRERQLDAPELLARRHPDAARRLAHGRIDARESGDACCAGSEASRRA